MMVRNYILLGGAGLFLFHALTWILKRRLKNIESKNHRSNMYDDD